MPLRQIKVGDLAACLMPKLLLALILAWWVAPAAAAENDEAIRAFVEKVNEASLGFFASGSEADARERYRALLLDGHSAVNTAANEYFNRDYAGVDRLRLGVGLGDDITLLDDEIVNAPRSPIRPHPPDPNLIFLAWGPCVGLRQVDDRRRAGGAQ
jgi:hypothetical protein